MNTMRRINAMIKERYGALIKQYDREPRLKKKRVHVNYNRRYSAMNKAERDARKQSK